MITSLSKRLTLIEKKLLEDKIIAAGKVFGQRLNSDGDQYAKVISLDDDDLISLGQIERLGGSADDYNTAGTNAYTEADMTIKIGATTVGAGSSTLVTLTTAFAQNPIVIPVANSTTDVTATVDVISESQFRLYNHGAASRTILWVALGRGLVT